ncbi:T9SS type A sorting domain-containing protein [Hymenobacter sp. 5516J-16]|uniref:T9SS type A sorting domain-containing protein n=1 Tax=Hymenobacter sp. 5516J-16 TaxID=2932253 RepID=UPI001FD100C1|nr:T9SS type A sorting domain-containing protein [Hymenobacter sp. 5516J-16]UOQ76262.1 T9SS type A sorting domain-containing protein [Hymenobacter sp. 5516J-16]
MAHSYSFGFFMRGLLGLTLSASAVSASAQNTPTGPTPVSVTAGAIYSQNFDGTAPTGAATTTAYPAGWAGVRLSGTGTANEVFTTLSVTDGSANSGGVYSVGTASATDRAMGSIASGSTVPAFGAVFTNGTGAAVTRVNVALRGEQWRSGSFVDQNEVLAFEYSLDATSLTTGTWVAATGLNVTEVANAITANAALNGNEAANRTAIAGSITLNWPAGATMWIRWKDTNESGSDALLAIDDFALSTGTTTLSSRKASGAGNVAVFPNPTSEVVTIQVAGRAEKAAVTVSDLTGRVVLRGTAAADGTFSLRPLQAGNYILLVQNGDTFTTHKVTKQ